MRIQENSWIKYLWKRGETRFCLDCFLSTVYLFNKQKEIAIKKMK